MHLAGDLCFGSLHIAWSTEAKLVFQQSAMFVERKFETDDRLFDLRLFSNSNYLITNQSLINL